MSQPSDEFLDETIAFWRPRLRRELSREDARQIVENLSGFFKILSAWEAEPRKRGDSGGDGVVDRDA